MPKHGGIAEILRTKQCPGISGTRDGFGIGKEFYDNKHGVIDTYKKWERAGYRDKIDLGSSERNQMVKHFAKDAKKKKKLDPKKVFL